MPVQRLLVVSLAILLILGACGGKDGGSSSTDSPKSPSTTPFSVVGGESGPSRELDTSVARFWGAIGIESPEAAEFLSPQCRGSNLPTAEPGMAPSAISYQEHVDGNDARVSYDVPRFDPEAAAADPSATGPQPVETLEIRDERWTRVDGLWLWDNCGQRPDDDQSNGSTVEP